MPLVRFLGAGLHELRVSKFRVYFVYGPETLHVLAQGEKDTQVRDIARARRRIS
jgi:putative component of toxin-antitoxin plasmid stabilization module